MKLILVAAFAAVALAKIPSSSWEQEKMSNEGSLEQRSFKRGNEYEFNYNGQVATGIPGSSRQHSATRIQARLSLVLKGEQKAILKIHHARMGKLNQHVPNPRAIIPFMAFQEVELSQEAAKELQLPVMFSYQQGLISDLVLDGQEKPWSANLKKGILNMLQVNLGKRGEIKQSEEAQVLNQVPQQQDPKAELFATHEKTVEGDCETLYTVVSNPVDPRENQAVLNVTRTIEYENCRSRPEVKYNFRFQDPCETCEPKFQEDQKFLKSSSVAKFNISGNREDFLIESAMVESQYQMVPFNREGNMLTTYMNQTLVLARSGPIRSKNVRQPKNPQQSDSDLMYSQDWDKDMEEFLMKGHSQARLPVDVKERQQILEDILRPLVSAMRESVSAQAPIHYAKLVKIIRFTEKSQLPQIFQHFVHNQPQSFSTEEHQKIKALLTDALADAATKDSISFLFQQIKEGKMGPLRATLTVKHLINIRTPSKEIVREFLQLLESSVVQENWMLKQSVQLTLGSVVQALCMPSEDRMALSPRPSFEKLPRGSPNTHLCPQQLQDQLLQKFFNIVEESDSEEQYEEAILALKTIGNMGIPKAVQKLEQIIRNQEQPQAKRQEAIMALRQLRETLPQKVQSVLLPVYLAKWEPSEVRVAAAFQLLQTLPARPVLDQMARSLFTERSRQVASFVFTYMQTLANSSNPCEAKFARDLKLALRHGRRISRAYQPQYSKYLHGSAYSQRFRLGADINLATFINNQTFVPKFAAMSLHATALGFWSKNLVGMGAGQQGIEQLVARFLRRTELSDISLDDILSRSPRAAQGPAKELKQLWKQLETVARQASPSAAPRGYAFLTIKDQEFFMLPITPKSLRQLPSVQEIRRQLQEGTHFNIHKAAMLHEMEYKIPTSIGFPIVVSLRIPTITQISGQVRIESRNPAKIHLNNVKPSMATSLLVAMSAWNPIVSSGVKVVATAKVFAPITAQAEVSYKGRQPELRLSMEPQQKAVEWLKLETRPATFTRQYRFPLTAYPEAEYKTIVGEQWNRVQNVRDCQIVKKTEQVIESVLGGQVRVQGTWHRTPATAPKYLPVCPFSGPNHLTIRTEPAQDQPKEYVLKMTAQIKKNNKDMSSEDFQMEDEDMEVEKYQTKQGVEAVVKTELSTRGGEERKAEMESQISFSPNLRVIKAENEIQVSAIPGLNQRQVKMCSSAFVQYPKSAQRFSQLRGKAVVGQLKTTWGQGSCQEQNKVEIKIAAKHSKSQEQQWKEEPEMSYWASSSQEERDQQPQAYAPLDRQQSLRNAQQLWQYNVQAQYRNIHPSIKNMTAKAFRALKAIYYSNTEEINFDIQNPSNIIRAQLTINPRNQQFFNLTVKTPVENVTITDAQLPMQIPRSPISIQQLQSQIRQPADLIENLMSPMLPVCRISSQRLQTFDQVSIRAPLSDCWTLLAKDCENEAEPSYAVLVKKQNQESQQKALKIMTPSKTIQINSESQGFGQLRVKVNGKQVSEEELPQNNQIQIQMEQDGQVVKVSLPQAGVRVSFDGYSARVQASPALQGRQCGICGHYNGEVSDEFRTPSNELVSDARRFIQAHTIKQGKCSFPQQLSDIDSSSEELSFQPRWEQEQGSQEGEQQEWDSKERSSQKSSSASSEEWDREEQVRPVQKHSVEEQGHKICVSVNKVPRCPQGTFPAKYEKEEKEVAFRCLNRGHAQAHRILKEARESRQLPAWLSQELQQQEPAYSANLPVPKLCSSQL